MSADFRMQVTCWHDSLAPADGITINPAFRVVGAGGADPAQLADDLAAAVFAKFGGATVKTRVRAYELPMVKPIIPVAEKFRGSTSPSSTTCRELALCLSYFCGQNTKRKRGRLYIPAFWLGVSSIANRPTTQNMTDALGWRSVFTGLGGVNVDWVLWSVRDQVSHPVTDVYVDNEWDVVRSRGLEGTLRQTATTSEGDVPNLARISSAAEPLAEATVGP